MMTQGVLPFKYQEEKNTTGMTALAGLGIYLDLANASGLWASIRRHVGVRAGEQGWTDQQVVMSLVLLNLAGGECVEDLDILQGDRGFGKLLQRVETYGMSRRERRLLGRRWRKGRCRSVPSVSAAFRYLGAFHNEGAERQRREHQAYIPEPNEHLSGMRKVRKDFVAFVQRSRPQRQATLDMDATLIETTKREALYCYKHYRAYQPINTYWVEQGMVLHTEFRDGNVPAGHEQLRVLKQALEDLPKGVDKVYVRSDTAGYQHDLLRYCECGGNERFGRIEFAIGCDVTEEFKGAVFKVKTSEWKPLRKRVHGEVVKTDQQWAEVCFVPNRIGHSKKGPEYRYIAIREPLRQLELPGMQRQQSLPFQVVRLSDGCEYKISAIVTNRNLGGEELIEWYRARCGESEQVHGALKGDLAGGKMPSGYFGVDAAWWEIVVLAFNLNAAMKRLVLGEGWIAKRMKAVRFGLIGLPGRIVERSRQLVVRLGQGHPSNPILFDARRTILALAHAPPG